MIDMFSLATTPQLTFGPGKIGVLESTMKGFGSKALIVTGASSFTSSSHGKKILEGLNESGLHLEIVQIKHEPSPAIIDGIVSKINLLQTNVVVAIGGGSVVDAGKAVSAMLPLRKPVKNYLEGVGKSVHPGLKIPFIAVPTTAGTGSEATKNAVISQTGVEGFKRSLRHNNFVPNVAIVDPELTLSCPPSVTAATGMDAFTQLLESYVSTQANPVTDALALAGLERISRSLVKAYHDGNEISTRSDLSFAAYLSGVTLANAGLGLVHGYASAIGGFFDIPHGVVCSSLMSAANQLTVKKLRATNLNPQALTKYATVGRIFSDNTNKPNDYYVDFLLDTIQHYTSELKIPTLSKLGIGPDSFEKIVKASDNKYNPVALDHNEMIVVLEMSATS
jgi:alcohol dehydrogenase class IV